MRKIVVHRAGGHERLRLEEHPSPEPGPGEVRVACEAAGVNYADCVVRMGLYASAKEYVGWPITPGFEVAGRIDALGAGVPEAELGRAVIALTRFGGYASQVCVAQSQVFALPPGITMQEGATFPVVALTAWYALHELAHVRSGMTLLVHSAAGGVGGTLLQLGRLAGCRVVGVVGASHKVDAARALGAHEVIDKSTEPLWPGVERCSPGGYDVVLDANGYSTLRQSYAHLAPEGKLVVYGFHSMLPRKGGRPNYARLGWALLRTPRFHPLHLTTHNRSVLGFNLSFLFHRTDLLRHAMGELLAHLAEGRLRKPSLRMFPLAQAADAHRALESGSTVGKLGLDCSP